MWVTYNNSPYILIYLCMNILSHSPKVSIIVLTYNQCTLYTIPCIESLLQTTTVNNCEIILVDNGSTDTTVQWMQQLKYPHITVINNKKNLGYAAGNNIGLKKAKGDIIILLNNDTLLPPGWLEPLIEPFKYNKKLGLLGPVTNRIGSPQQIKLPGYTNNTSLQQQASIDPSWIDAATTYMRHQVGTITPTPMLCFFCVAISKQCLDTVGLLDEQFQKGNFEDDDYCIRVQQQGFHIAYTDASFVWHHGEGTLSQLPQKVRASTWFKNQTYFKEKHDQLLLLTDRAQNCLESIKQELKKIQIDNYPNTTTIERCLAHLPYVNDILIQLERLEKESYSIKGTLLRMAKHIDASYFGSFFKSLLYPHKNTKPRQ